MVNACFKKFLSSALLDVTDSTNDTFRDAHKIEANPTFLQGKELIIYHHRVVWGVEVVPRQKHDYSHRGYRRSLFSLRSAEEDLRADCYISYHAYLGIRGAPPADVNRETPHRVQGDHQSGSRIHFWSSLRPTLRRHVSSDPQLCEETSPDSEIPRLVYVLPRGCYLVGGVRVCCANLSKRFLYPDYADTGWWDCLLLRVIPLYENE